MMSKSSNHPDLSDIQMLAVGSTYPLSSVYAIPPPTVESLIIHDLGELERSYPSPKPSAEERYFEKTLAGWCAVYRCKVYPMPTDFFRSDRPEGPPWMGWVNQVWWSGGGSGSTVMHTREQAIKELWAMAYRRWLSWEHRVREMQTGDLTKNGYPIIRCEGHHYTLGDYGRNIRGAGYGGHQFRFRMKDTGQIVLSRNVWSQGEIPLEYLSILIDNAEMV